jgi:phosphoglycerate dehydrogenase-like enzyme
MKLVIYPPIEDARLLKVREAAGSMEVVNARSSEEAISQIVDADAFFGRLTPPMLAAAQQLRWVQTLTASLEHYLFPELVKHPCILTNMRGLFYDVIADHVFGYVLCFARNLHTYIRQQIHATWEPIGGETVSVTHGPGQISASDRVHMHLSDCTMGIVGLGSIGAEIARRALSFGMPVIAVDPDQTAAPDGVEALWPLTRLPDLLQASDFVVIAAPHTPETEGMFGQSQFAQMKNSAILINIGRGVIVKLADLVDALEQGEIAGAALDVFEQEPLPTDHPLWRCENAILTPHVAACSVRIAERHLEVLLDNVSRFEHGDPLRNIADKERWF